MGCVSSAPQRKASARLSRARVAATDDSAWCPEVTEVAKGRNFESFYRVDDEQKLGKGHFATVHVARALQRKNAEVAIKRVSKTQRSSKPQYAAAELKLLQLAREERVHHIVELLDVFETPTHVLFVLELMRGGELFASLVNNGAYTEADAVRPMRGLCAALAFMHRRTAYAPGGIAHRDIKPQNLLLSGDPAHQARPVLKVADFGLARRCPDPDAPDEHTQALPARLRGKLRAACGTWAYMAPEVLCIYHGHRGGGYDTKCDMYAVGIILFVILSGYHPFDPDGLNTPERMQALMIKGLWSFDDLGGGGNLGTPKTSTRGSGRQRQTADNPAHRRVAGRGHVRTDTGNHTGAWAFVSAEACDLIKRLLAQDPDERMSAEEALQHPWLAPVAPRTPPQPVGDTKRAPPARRNSISAAALQGQLRQGVDLALEEFQARMRRKLKAAGHATMAVAHMSLLRRNSMSRTKDELRHSTGDGEAVQAVAAMAAAKLHVERHKLAPELQRSVRDRAAPLSQGGAPVAAEVRDASSGALSKLGGAACSTMPEGTSVRTTKRRLNYKLFRTETLRESWTTHSSSSAGSPAGKHARPNSAPSFGRGAVAWAVGPSELGQGGGMAITAARHSPCTPKMNAEGDGEVGYTVGGDGLVRADGD